VKRTLRATYFTAQESAGLFGQEDARDDDTVARMAALADSTLDEAQRSFADAEPALRFIPELAGT
jgi:hypothetical protein